MSLHYPFMSPELLNDEVLVPRDGITANCRRVLLIQNASGRWRRFRSFELRCQA